jgi:sterol desaturase/sphingolipid hydroxylase (fatty acid hydroxylase superfamily)
MMSIAWDAVQTASLAALVALPQAHNDRMLLTVCFVLTHSVVWVAAVAFYLAIRWSGRFERYSVNGGAKPPRSLLIETALNTLLNHILLQWLFTYFVVTPVFAACGALNHFASPHPPALTTHVWHLALCIVIQDATFYWTHRLLHTPFLYRTVHKRHHAFVANHPLAVEHAHVVESIVGNLLPLFLPCILSEMSRIRTHAPELPHKLAPHPSGCCSALHDLANVGSNPTRHSAGARHNLHAVVRTGAY